MIYNHIMINIVFFGSSQHSVSILQQLLSHSDFNLQLVITKEDKPVGRDQTITPNPVAQFSRNHQLKLLQISEFTPDVISTLKNLKSSLYVCVAFGPPFFSQEVIDIPTHGILNIHPSPLPKYRGATPGPWQIINGEAKSSVSFFLIDALPDHGPIISQIPFDISPTETSVSFYQKAFDFASQKLHSIITDYISGILVPIPQDHTQKSYFPKFDKNTAQINWTWDTAKVDRFIRAMLPWPIAWTYVSDQKNAQLKMKIFSSHLQNNQLVPDEVQIEGKTRTLWSQIQNYYQINKTN